MTLRDLITISTGNLTRMKLRTVLTVAGVVVAIGTFVAMLSFGAGNQRYVTEQFEALGLFHTMQVYPLEKKSTERSDSLVVLDSAALGRLAQLPGVRMAYPFDAFTCQVTIGDSQVTSQAQAVSREALAMKWFSRIAAGSTISGDSSGEAIVTTRLLDKFGLKADSAVGRQLVVQVRMSSVDSGLAQVLPIDRQYIRQRIKEIDFDSLLNQDYARQLVRTELNSAMSRFLGGFFNNRALVSDTLTICGVILATGPQERNMSPILVPIATAQRLTSGLVLDDPTALMGALQSGRLLATGANGSGKSYGHITLDLEPMADQKIVADSIKAMGYRSFSFADQFKEIQKFFFYFDLALGVIGIIALVTASLGIINTLVMSVLERRKEIGILKSLGADERDIRLLFLVESAVIGLLGSVFGILLGWIISRAASYIGQAYMAREGLEGIDLFALPWWLIGAAMTVGLAGSLLAGLYPAARAARVDPIEALRND